MRYSFSTPEEGDLEGIFLPVSKEVVSATGGSIIFNIQAHFGELAAQIVDTENITAYSNEFNISNNSLLHCSLPTPRVHILGCVKGNVDFIIPGSQTLHLSAGRFYVLLEHRLVLSYAFKVKENVQIYDILVAPSLIKEMVQLFSLENFLQCQAEGKGGYVIDQGGWMSYEIVQYFSSFFSSNLTIPILSAYLDNRVKGLLFLCLSQQFHFDSTKTSTSRLKKAWAAVGYIRANLNATYTSTSLAALLQANENELEKDFTEITGMAFAEFTLVTRMKEAKKRIEESEDDLKKIAVSLGYNLFGTFFKDFLSVNGVDPYGIRRE